MGYDLFTQNLYKIEQSVKEVPSNHQDPKWISWGIKKTTELLEKIFHTVKSNRSDCLVSISPNPLDFAKKYYLADWELWVKKGLAEEIVLQVYRDNLPRFLGEISKLEVVKSKNHIPVSIGILTGLKNKPVALDWIKEQIHETRAAKLSGVSFFFYESLFNEIVLNPSNILQITARDLAQVEDLFV